MANLNRDLLNSEPNANPANDRTSAIRNFQNRSLSADEVIVWLANTHENKRARQVSEWQRAQSANVRRIY